MILTAAGQPAPPAGMVERLHEIDAGLGLLYSYKDSCWKLTYDWPESDPRRAFIRRGEVAPERAFDILAALPPDCSADEAYGYVVSTFKRLSGKPDIDRMLARVAAYNAKQQDDLLKPHRELAKELIETNAKTLFRNEGKTIGRSMAPRSRKNTDEKRRRDYLHDLGHAVTPSSRSVVKHG